MQHPIQRVVTIFLQNDLERTQNRLKSEEVTVCPCGSAGWRWLLRFTLAVAIYERPVAYCLLGEFTRMDTPAILARRARQEAIEAQKREDESRTWFRIKVALIAALIFGFVNLVLTGEWSAIFLWVWYLFISTCMLANGVGSFFASKSLFFPLSAIIVTVTLVLWFNFTKVDDTWSERVGAVAADGTVSSATGRGAASHHGGVSHWLTTERTRVLTSNERWQRGVQFGTFLSPIIITSVCLMLERHILGIRKIYELRKVA